MKESDMYEPVKQFLLDELQCDRVVAEVFDFDVLGLCGNKHNVIVEMKRGLNFKVIRQAMKAKTYAHWVYIAVLRPTKRNDDHEWIYNTILKPNGIGLLYVRDPDKTHRNFNSDIPIHDVNFAIEKRPQRWMSPSVTDKPREISVARYNRLPNKERRIWAHRPETHTHASYIRSNIPEWAEENIGGVKGGDARKVTSYSKLMDGVKTFLESINQYNDSAGVDIRAIVNQIPIAQSHYSDPVSSLRATLQESWNSEWIDTQHYKKEKRFRLNYENPNPNPYLTIYERRENV